MEPARKKAVFSAAIQTMLKENCGGLKVLVHSLLLVVYVMYDAYQLCSDNHVYILLTMTVTLYLNALHNRVVSISAVLHV